MRADYATKKCLLNHFVEGEWGRQREITVFPFKRGMHFDLIIKCDIDVFQVRKSIRMYLKQTHVGGIFFINCHTMKICC